MTLSQTILLEPNRLFRQGLKHLLAGTRFDVGAEFGQLADQGRVRGAARQQQEPMGALFGDEMAGEDAGLLVRSTGDPRDELTPAELRRINRVRRRPAGG